MSQNAGRVGFTLKGAYDASTTYTMLNVVTYQGGSYAAKSTTTGNAPTNTTYWQKLTDTEVATVNSLGVVQPDGTSVTIDANGVISATASAGVASFNGRTGAVVPTAADYAADQVSFDPTLVSTLSSTDVQSAIATLANRVGCRVVSNFPITANQSTHTAVYSGMGITAASVPIQVYVANPAAISSSSITVETGAGGLITVTATATASTTMDIILVDRYYT